MTRFVSLLRQNNGMTMVEMTVALVLGAVILTAGAGTLASAMGGVNYSRQNQQSAALISEIIEETRGASYAGVAVKRDVSVLDADGRVTGAGGEYYVDPDDKGPLGTEKLILSDTGSVPLFRIVERNGTRYSVSTYVSAPAGADADFRRVTTVVTWTKGAKSHERRTASFVTSTRRGLPLPNFSIAQTVSATVNAGAQLRLPVEVTNSGARDAWNMTASTSPSRPWTVSFYADNTPQGSFGPEDLPLVDTDGDGRGDTGLLETDQVKKMWAVADVPSSDAAGAVTVKLTATSSSDSTYAESVDDPVTVVTQACTTCTFVTYHLKNASGPIKDSNLQSAMLLEETVPGPFAGMPNYDKDKDSLAGRTLWRSGTAGKSEAQMLALWETMVSGSLTLQGTATVNLVVAPEGVAPTETATVHVYLTRKSGSIVTPIADGALSFSFSGPSFQNLPISLTVPNTTLANNERLQLRVVLAGGLHQQVLLGYGTEPYPANIQLPKI